MRRQRDQRGAMAIFLSMILCLILVPLGALAVDIGMQRVARSDMQSLADAIALDLARQLDGSTAASAIYPTLSALAAKSLAQNQGNTYSDTAAVKSIDLGTVDSTQFGTSGYFTKLATTSGAFPTAVRVTMTTPVGFAFMPSSSGGATRSSIAVAASTACFRLGSYGLGINTSNSVLLKGLVESALGGSVNVTALGYQGLASANISLTALAAELGVGTVDQLMALNSVSVANLYIAAADVLTQNGDAANAAILNSIAAHVGSLPPISIAGLIAASSGYGAAEAATINVLDLVAGSAFIANGSALSIPNLAVNLGLTGTSLTASASLIQSPQPACGKVDVASTSTSQANLAITGTLASIPSLPTSLLGLSAAVAADSTKIKVDLAKATGTLKAIVCGAGTVASPEGIDVLVGSQLGVVTSLDQTISVSGSLTGSGILGGLLGGLLGSILRVNVSGSVRLQTSTSQPQENRTATIRIPNSPTSYSIPVSTGSGSIGLETANITVTSSLTLTASGLLGIPITLNASQITALTSGIVSGLTSNIVGPLVSSINSTLVTPLTELLGVDIAGADVYGVPRPLCSNPSLAG